MANTVVNLVDLDFNTFKNSLKTYAKEQALFKDYDFDGSNFSVLQDILAYNTYHNAYYLNMLFSEMFLDSAQLRNSVASHAKDLNYLPRSFQSAKAIINIDIATDDSVATVTIPKNQPFSTRVDSATYQFVTAETIVLTEKTNGVFSARDVEIYEGTYALDTFYSNYSLDRQRFILSDPTIDISSITVVVSDDEGAATHRYATSLLDIGSTDEVYFLQPAENDRYEIVFGNGVIGKKPKNGSTIYVEYRTCSGELPNGAVEFSSDRNIGSWGDVSVSSVTDSNGDPIRASGGSIHESLEDVKFNAPRHYQTQERAITVNDYKIMLQQKYPEINALSVYGGEDAVPPQYGRVFIAVDLFGFDGIPNYKKDEYKQWLANRIPLTVDPVFIDPTFAFGALDLTIRYNQNKTDLTTADISSRVRDTVIQYSVNKFNDFNVTVRYSKLIAAIDGTHSSVLSNESMFKVYKPFRPTLNVNSNYTIDFAFQLKKTLPKMNSVHPNDYERVLTSSQFTYNGKTCRLEDDNAGVVRIVFSTPNKTTSSVKDVGKIDYDTGVVTLTDFIISRYEGAFIKVYATPRSNDVIFGRGDYFEIKSEDIAIDVIGVRE